MQIQPTKILSANRISLPKTFLDHAKLKEGDFVGVIFSDGKLIIQPIRVEARK